MIRDKLVAAAKMLSNYLQPDFKQLQKGQSRKMERRQ